MSFGIRFQKYLSNEKLNSRFQRFIKLYVVSTNGPTWNPDAWWVTRTTCCLSCARKLSVSISCDAITSLLFCAFFGVFTVLNLTIKRVQMKLHAWVVFVWLTWNEPFLTCDRSESFSATRSRTWSFNWSYFV